jgi:hypothetical protein
MNLTEADLLPAERSIMTKAANMVVSVKESGLSRFAFDDLMWVAGMKGKEAIGGKAHLTNYRIIFKSHSFNRLRGSHTIFLPNVVSVTPRFDRLIVETEYQRFQFVMWFKASFIKAVQQEKNALNEVAVKKLQEVVVKHPEVIGTGLQQWATLEVVNQIFLAGRKLASVLDNLSGNEKNAFLEFLSLMQK